MSFQAHFLSYMNATSDNLYSYLNLPSQNLIASPLYPTAGCRPLSIYAISHSSFSRVVRNTSELRFTRFWNWARYQSLISSSSNSEGEGEIHSPIIWKTFLFVSKYCYHNDNNTLSYLGLQNTLNFLIKIL